MTTNEANAEPHLLALRRIKPRSSYFEQTRIGNTFDVPNGAATRWTTLKTVRTRCNALCPRSKFVAFAGQHLNATMRRRPASA